MTATRTGTEAGEARRRLRDLGIVIGHLPTGPLNAITDVPGVAVGHCTLTAEEPAVVRSGVTAILATGEALPGHHLFGGFHAFNGFGEMTGAHWIEESGLLTSPIVLTSTYSIGAMRDALIQYRHRPGGRSIQPVVAETNDGWLNDGSAPVLGAAHLEQAIAAAGCGPVPEGNVGGGTGMICHGFKGGIGTASRIVGTAAGSFTIGVLVQANYGRRDELTVAGVPVGRRIDRAVAPLARPEDGSIIIVVATDAPLLPGQCARLARRATIGLGRVGGTGANGSGDLFLAFSTANRIPPDADRPIEGLAMLPQSRLSPLFSGVAEAVEEAILNALCQARTMTGQRSRIVHALPLEGLAALVGG